MAAFNGSICLALVALAAAPAFSSEPGPVSPAPERIVATARVIVSDGTEFGAVMEYEAPLNASYSQDFSDLDMRFETDGENVRVWQNGEEAENPPRALAGWVLGHQFHAQLLRFDELNGGIAAQLPYRGEGDCPCVELRGIRANAEMGVEAYGLVLNSESRRPQRLMVHRFGETPVVTRFDDWRNQDGLDLPYRVVVDDGRDVYDFHFSSIEVG